MNKVNIELFPASYGESILVSCQGKNKTNILIDMGFISTYNNSIRNRLKILKDNEQCINLLVFTHLDADHMSGGLAFLKENGNALKPSIISVNEIWFNSIKHLPLSTRKIQLNDKEKLILKTICSKRYPRELYVGSTNDISCQQALTLCRLINENGYNWNEMCIKSSTSKELNEIIINDEVKVIILSPTENKLNDLIDVWKDELLSMGIKSTLSEDDEYDKAFELLLVNLIPKIKTTFSKECSLSISDIEKLSKQENFNEDKDKVNGSSISFILEFYRRKFLFLADSHPRVIEEGLRHYMKNECEKIHFDAVKISHHGSANNTSVELLNMISCNKFIICTNGARFEHPDDETIARIICSDTTIHKKIISNYKSKSIKKFNNNHKLMAKYNYEIISTNDIHIPISKCRVTNISIEGEKDECIVTVN